MSSWALALQSASVMANPLAGKGKTADDGDEKSASSRATASRHRQLIEAAVVAGEIASAVVADTRSLIDYSKRVIARPYMTVTGTPVGASAPRQIPVCERCGHNIDTPGIAIVRGRMVMHVRCDSRLTA